MQRTPTIFSFSCPFPFLTTRSVIVHSFLFWTWVSYFNKSFFFLFRLLTVIWLEVICFKFSYFLISTTDQFIRYPRITYTKNSIFKMISVSVVFQTLLVFFSCVAAMPSGFPRVYVPQQHFEVLQMRASTSVNPDAVTGVTCQDRSQYDQTAFPFSRMTAF